MGTVVVNCLNRPKDEMIDCGAYGMLQNMHSHEHPGVEGELVLGFPLEGKKLPTYGGSEPTEATKAAKATKASSEKEGEN